MVFGFLAVLLPLAAWSAPLSPECELELVERAASEGADFHSWFGENLTEEQLEALDNRAKESNGGSAFVRNAGLHESFNSALEIMKRERNGDPHAKWLKRLGIRIKNGKTEKANFVLPKDATKIPALINAYVKRLVRDGHLKESEAIYTALVYQKPPPKGDPFTFSGPQYRFEDLVLVRPGIDEPPNPREYKLLEILPQFPHTTWEKILASGRMPYDLFLGGFLAHDLAHITELLDDPALMAAVRSYYSWSSKQTLSWRSKVTHLRGNEGKGLFSPGVLEHSERLYLASENFALVEESRWSLVREALPDFFGKAPPKDWLEHVKKLRRLGEDALSKRARAAYKLAHKAASRIGGSMRDPYNLPRLLNRERGLFQPLARVIFERQTYQNPIPARGVIPSMPSMAESFLGMAESVRWILEGVLPLREEKLPADARDRALKLLKELVAQLETGMAYAVIDEMRPEDLYLDLRSRLSDPKSKTARFIARFAREGGALWRMFLSPEATGKNEQSFLTYLVEVEERNANIKAEFSHGRVFIAVSVSKNPPAAFENAPDYYLELLRDGSLVDAKPDSFLNSSLPQPAKTLEQLVNRDRAPARQVFTTLKLNLKGIRTPLKQD